MKKILILCLFIISICFTQTGMITPKGEEGFGVWFHAAAYNIEYDDANPEFDLSFGYMMDNGIEVGLDYKLDNGIEGLNWNPITAKIGYHDKSPSGSGFVLGFYIFNVTEADAEDDYWIYETESVNLVGVNGYTDDLFSLGILYNMDADDNATSISLGKMFDMDSFYLGIGYKANTEWLDEGWVTFSVGSKF